MRKRDLIFFLAFACTVTVLFPACDTPEIEEAVPRPDSLAGIVARGESDLFTIPFGRYGGDIGAFPIGVFDSGIGGLTVLEEILTIDRYANETHLPGTDGLPDFERERFVYLGDQANMPYGNYPSEGKTDFLRELILKDAVFLLGDRYWPSAGSESPRSDKEPVKAIVIACNTATAYGLDDVREALAAWNLPVYLVGVVEAGAKGAVETLKGAGGGAVAVMATVGTCSSEGYVRAVTASAELAGIDAPEVIQQGCLGLAGAIEGDRSYIVGPDEAGSVDYRGPGAGSATAAIDPGLADVYGFEPGGLLGNPGDPASWRLNSVENYIRYHTATLVHSYSLSQPDVPITTVILGCTHFPYYADRIREAFDRLRSYRAKDGGTPYRRFVAENLTFIDPARLTAMQLYEALADAGLLLGGGEPAAIPVDEFYISVPNPSLPGAELDPNGGFTYGYKYGRQPGRLAVEYVKRVPMSGETLSPSVRESIAKSMVMVWDRLVTFTVESPRTEGLPADARLK